jgi:probable rRNA maturation factor
MANVAALDLDVVTETQAWTERLPDVVALCREAAGTAFIVAGGHRQFPGVAADACLLLSDDERIRALNNTFRGRDEPTDVLSFPSAGEDVLAAAGADAPPSLLGDIIIAFETTAAEAAAAGKSLGTHLRHLVVHGVLHLLGYDHVIDADAVEMEALEVRVLARLGIADPYTTADED